MSRTNYGHNLFEQIYANTGDFVLLQPPTTKVQVQLDQEGKFDVQQDPANDKNIVEHGKLPSGVNIGYVYDGDFIHMRQDELRLIDGAVLSGDFIQDKFAPLLFERTRVAEPQNDLQLQTNYMLDIMNNTHADGTPQHNMSTLENTQKANERQIAAQINNVLAQIRLLLNSGVDVEDEEIVRLRDRILELRTKLNPQEIVANAIRESEEKEMLMYVERKEEERRRHVELIEEQRAIRERLEEVKAEAEAKSAIFTERELEKLRLQQEQLDIMREAVKEAKKVGLKGPALKKFKDELEAAVFARFIVDSDEDEEEEEEEEESDDEKSVSPSSDEKTYGKLIEDFIDVLLKSKISDERELGAELMTAYEDRKKMKPDVRGDNYKILYNAYDKKAEEILNERENAFKVVDINKALDDLTGSLKNEDEKEQLAEARQVAQDDFVSNNSYTDLLKSLQKIFDDFKDAEKTASGSPKKASPKSVSPKSASPKKASPKSASPSSASPKSVSPKSVSPSSDDEEEKKIVDIKEIVVELKKYNGDPVKYEELWIDNETGFKKLRNDLLSVDGRKKEITATEKYRTAIIMLIIERNGGTFDNDLFNEVWSDTDNLPIKEDGSLYANNDGKVFSVVRKRIKSLLK